MAAKLFLWSIAGLCLLIFLGYLRNFVRTKFVLWLIERKLNQIAKNTTGETKDKLLEVVAKIKEINKNQKVIEEDDDY